MRTVSLALVLLLGVAHIASAETKYIPYVSQGPEWSIAFHFLNVCERASTYKAVFKDSDGEPMELIASGEVWPSMYYDERHRIGPKQFGLVYFPPEGEARYGYAKVV